MPVFPVPDWIRSYDYKHDPRRFGASRDHGTRLHAGCDLYAPLGAHVLAVAGGHVIRGPYYFYSGTWAIEVDHGDFVVRYGEISGNQVAGIQEGAKVTAGQLIGYVGHLQIKAHSMLHFEMYRGTAQGRLAQHGNKYSRRHDLMDPTPYLDRWQQTHNAVAANVSAWA